MASLLEIISPTFSNEGSNSSCIFSLKETALAISLSDSNPKARINVTNGISTGDPGIFATIEPSGFIISSNLAL